MLYTAAIDNRYGNGKVSSRIGLTADASVFRDSTNFFAEISHQVEARKIACVLVDEAQFLSRTQVDHLARVVDELNIPVLCFGIRTDFQGELFSGSERLLAIADKLKELKTVCSCGRKATMTIRIDDAGKPITAGAQVEIGGNDRYESKCRRDYYALINQKQ